MLPCKLRGTGIRPVLALSSLLLGGLSLNAAHAQLTPIASFAGNYAETWESFPNYLDGGFHLLPASASILGGQATLSNTNAVIYEPFAADASLGLSGFAQTADGVKGLQVGNLDPTATLTFASPLTAFGAYWGAETFGGASTVTVDFFDPQGVSLGTETFAYDHEALADGGLDWHGWRTSALIGSLTITGNNFVADGLQASVVPEAGTFSLLLAGIGSLTLSLRTRRRAAR